MAEAIKGKRVLVVDDEPDICQLVRAILREADVDTAFDFKEANEKLASGHYDVVILDIMGVDGHSLLQQFSGKYPCIMLTAHALTADDFERSRKGRAVLYLPKDELHRLEEYVAKVLETPRGTSLWGWLVRKVDFTRYFGSDWKKQYEDMTAELSDEEMERYIRGKRD